MRFQEFRVLKEADTLSAISQVANLANTFLDPFGSMGGSNDTATGTGADNIPVTGKPNATAKSDIKIIQDPDFNKKLEKVANALGVKSNDLLAIMKQESGVNPQAVNKSSGATGLIQFIPKTARGLGTTTDALYKMSAVEQLDYVYLYYKNIGLKPGSNAGDIYVATFYPAAAGKPDNHVISSRGDKIYRQNAGLDRNKDNTITVADVKNSVARFV